MIEQLSEVTGPDALRRLNQAYPKRYPFLLQSTTAASGLGRFDILFAFPGKSVVLKRAGEVGGTYKVEDNRFLRSLDRWWLSERRSMSHNPMPFHGGWFLYLGYELAEEIEPGLILNDDPLLPTAFAVRCPVALIYDHLERSCNLVFEAENCVDYAQLKHDLGRLSDFDPHEEMRRSRVTDDDPHDFLFAVRTAKKYIAAGDVYQANLSRQWTALVAEDLRPETIYEALCRSNPGPFAGIAHWQDTAIISSSPERLMRVRDGEISTRPIAGTRPRGENESADDSLSNELFAHPKERAEHVMLIDLERNDLGRVCKPGSVEVDEMMVLESYAHVHHIVSNVRGQLKTDVTPGAAIAAVFPGGTITGCPKVRCMEIINELEHAPRGAYTGSFGYLNLDGSMDLNILIRTMVKKGDRVTFRAGSGIVADSDPDSELDETRAKAEGMLRALT